MSSKIRLGLTMAVSVLPLNALRVHGYRALGYDIRDSRIGLGTVIVVNEAKITSARIGPFNLFIGPITVVVGRGATIGNRNEFSCGDWVTDEQYRESGYGRSLVLAAGSTITSRHFFDLAGTLRLGERSWVAGLGSQFWTHGAGAVERDVTIGSDCYIGSVVRFAPGSSIGDNVIVAIGSVVSGRIASDDALVGGVPAKVLKADYDWRSRTVRSTRAE